MSVSIRGELTEVTRTHFEHPKSGALTPELSSLTALGYAIQKGNLQETREIIRGEPRWLLNDADYNLNTPVVSTLSTSSWMPDSCHSGRHGLSTPPPPYCRQ
jgi:lysophospholipase